MGPQVSMAGSVSINKRKTSAAGTCWHVVAGRVTHRSPDRRRPRCGVGATVVVALIYAARLPTGRPQGSPLRHRPLPADFHGFA
jgi:hypothetical protein